MSEQKKDEELGALWAKRGPKGEYMTGTIGGQKVVVFKNTRAENNEKAPTWRVYKSKPREAAAAVSSDDVPW